MLKLLRNKKTAKWIWIGLAIIIMPAFVFWGLGGAMRDKNDSRYLGSIAGKKITPLEYNDSLKAVRNTAIMRFGEDNLAAVEKALNLEAQAWQRLALIGAAKKLKIKATDQEVIEQIESNPNFMRQGKFDNGRYNELLKYVFHTQARAFEEQTRQNIIISKLYQKITEEITASDKEIREEYQKIKSANNPKFKFDENKFLTEKKEFDQAVLEKKKEEYFSKFIAEQLK